MLISAAAVPLLWTPESNGLNLLFEMFVSAACPYGKDPISTVKSTLTQLFLLDSSEIEGRHSG